MNEVNLEEKRMQEEDRAMKAFQSGKHAALSIKDLLQKLDRPDQNILYYIGGIQVLTGAVKECECLMQSLFPWGVVTQVDEYNCSIFEGPKSHSSVKKNIQQTVFAISTFMYSGCFHIFFSYN